MPTTCVAGFYSGKLQWNHIAIEHSDHPPDRPHKTLRRSCPPVHILGPVDRSDFLWKKLGQNVSGLTSFAHDSRRKIFTFLRFNPFQFLDRNASLLGKRLRSGSGSAILEGNLHGWTLELLLNIGLS